MRLQVLNHVSLSFAVDKVSTSRSCDNASKKRETKTSFVNRSCQSGRKLCISEKRVVREHELVTQRSNALDAVNFKTRMFVFRRFEVIWCVRWMR